MAIPQPRALTLIRAGVTYDNPDRIGRRRNGKETKVRACWTRTGALLAIATCLLVATPSGAGSQVSPDDSAIARCEITVNVEAIAETTVLDDQEADQYLGTPDLAVGLDPTGIVRASEVGDSYRARMPWIAAGDSVLEVTAENTVSGEEATVKVAERASSTIEGWYAVTLDFPELGCWKLTGTLGDETISVTVLAIVSH